MTVQLAVRDLTVVYPAPGGGAFPALGPISFQIEAGTFVCLIGPSGCGKSTLIRLLGGLQSPTRGQAFLGESVIREPSRRVGLMFQDANLMPWRTVVDNIALPLELAGVSPVARTQSALALLPKLGLSAEFAQSYPAELSGGMAQRVALGRVLIQEPEVLLLDEPTEGIQPSIIKDIANVLNDIRKMREITIIVSEQVLSFTMAVADRIIVIDKGKFIHEDRREDVDAEKIKGYLSV